MADETDNDRDLIVLVEPNQWRVDGRFPVEDAVEKRTFWVPAGLAGATLSAVRQSLPTLHNLPMATSSPARWKCASGASGRGLP